jgi:hypothetical protein
MRKLFTLFITSIIVFSCTKDNGETADKASFIRFYGGSYYNEGMQIKQLPDKSYLVISKFTNENQITGGKIHKLNETGDVIWEYESIDSLDLHIEDLYVNEDQSIIFTGYGINPPRNNDVVLGKLSAQGQEQWKIYSGGEGNQLSKSICRADDGGYIIGGSTNKTGNKNIYLQKFSSEGDSLWTRNYGSPSEDEVYDICQSYNGGFIITGSYGFVAPNQTGLNMAAIEINQLGILIDIFSFEGYGDDVGFDVDKTDDGYIFVGNTHNPNNPETDILIVKTGISIREIEWIETYGGSDAESGNEIYMNSDGTYTIVGSTESMGEGNMDGYILNISSSGSVIIEKTQGSIANEWLNSVIETYDGGFGMVGGSEYNENSMLTFIKLNKDYEQE